MLLRLCAMFGILVASPAFASDLAGTWDFRVTSGILFQIEVRQASTGLRGTWVRPEAFHHIDDAIIFDVAGPVVTRAARQVREIDGDVELTFDHEAASSQPIVLRLRMRDANSIQLSYVGKALVPFILVRSTGAKPVGPWDSRLSYAAANSHDSNPEMTAMFVADQNDRKADVIDWKMVSAADAKRLERTQQILNADRLHTGSDFNYAAFIFQHGHKPDDYLKAHLLALVAVARGRQDALWIASASLDRYLLSIGQSQVLGTQSSAGSGEAAEPYNRMSIPDALRSALQVPTLPEQEAQRQASRTMVSPTATDKKY